MMGLYTAPKIILPSSSTPILTQQIGIPLAKLMVPSIGSIIHLIFESCFISPVSSLNIKCEGKAS